MDPNTLIVGLAPVVILLLSGVGWLYRNETQKVKEIQEKLNDKKITMYTNMLNAMLTFITSYKTGDQTRVEKLVKAMLEAQKTIIMYGSDEVFRKFSEFMIDCRQRDPNDQSRERAIRGLRKFAALIVEVRRDMGEKHTTLKEDDVLRFLLKDFDEYTNTTQEVDVDQRTVSAS